MDITQFKDLIENSFFKVYFEMDIYRLLNDSSNDYIFIDNGKILYFSKFKLLEHILYVCYNRDELYLHNKYKQVTNNDIAEDKDLKGWLLNYIINEVHCIDGILSIPVHDTIVEKDNRIYYNEFEFPEHMITDNYKCDIDVNLKYLKSNAPYIYKLLSNLHNHNDKGIEDTLIKITDKIRNPNKKAQDCIVFYPGQGAGKGIFFYHILERLVTSRYAKKILMKKLDSDFNAFLKEPLFLVLEEGKSNNSLIESLKELVTEQSILINKKGTDHKMTNIYFLTFIFSNNMNPVNMGTRRGSYHICKPLSSDPEECERIGNEIIKNIDKEFIYLLKYIHNLKYDERDAYKTFESVAKQQVIDLNKSGIELFYSFMLDFDSLQSVANNLFTQDFSSNYNLYRSKIGDKIYISKSVMKDMYNKFCFNENLRSNIVRNNRDLAQLWVLLNLPEHYMCRSVIKEGPNKGRRMDHISMTKIDEHICRVSKTMDEVNKE